MSLEYTPYVPVKRYLLEISYDGTNYCGWQIQPHSPSVQEVIQNRMFKFYDRQPIHLIGASRTDTGVHAKRFAASFLAPERPAIPMERIFKALNRQLPEDIKIHSIREVPLDFHARYEAKGKAYTYVVNLGGLSPFNSRYSWKPIHEMDVEKIRAASHMLTGTHDFSSFVVERSMIDDAVRTIYRIETQVVGQFCCVTFIGNGFLYKMIRCLMGTLEAAGSGKLTPADVKEILEAKNRLKAPETAPPNGLFLMKVFYDQQELENYRPEGIPFL